MNQRAFLKSAFEQGFCVGRIGCLDRAHTPHLQTLNKKLDYPLPRPKNILKKANRDVLECLIFFPQTCLLGVWDRQ